LKYKAGDLILHNGILWTIVSREKKKYIVLESGRRSWKVWTYELDFLFKKFPDTKYFPVVE
jgi:hypothetical protein